MTIKQLRDLLSEIPDDTTCLIKSMYSEPESPSGRSWIEWFICMAENIENKKPKSLLRGK